MVFAKDRSEEQGRAPWEEEGPDEQNQGTDPQGGEMIWFDP